MTSTSQTTATYISRTIPSKSRKTFPYVVSIRNMETGTEEVIAQFTSANDANRFAQMVCDHPTYQDGDLRVIARNA